MNPRGNFIDNQWVRPDTGGSVKSVNPATAGDVVLEVPTDPGHAALAVEAAHAAQGAWGRLPIEERISGLRRFARELGPRTESLARAITSEMGKPIREARGEARSLIARVDLVAEHQLPQVRPWSPTNVDGECRYHPLGVIAVIGPFNYPLHLVHAHVIPALATGNTVVIKPSERAPLAAQRYVEAFEAAGLPPVLQMVQGGGDVGQALLEAQALRGVAFTGSWRTGHAIQRALIDRPEVLAALEMGGQNMAIVCADADLDQALEGVLLGAYLSAGQRCTCTSRVLVDKSVADGFIARLVKAAARLSVGDPSGDFFMGPMAAFSDRDNLDALCQAGVDAGAEILLAAERPPGGAYRGPSVHLIQAGHASAYTTDEVFGPDLAVTIVDGLSEAIDIVNSSAYGLSVSVFSTRRAAFETTYHQTSVGCVNWNRSTNRASGTMPFGGIGRSGNFRPAGSDAVRYTTYPVQVQWNAPGAVENDPYVRAALGEADPIAALEAVHRIEEALEPYGIYPEVTPGAPHLTIPLAQLDQSGVILSTQFAEGLKNRGVQADLVDGALRIPQASGAAATIKLVRAVTDAAYALRVHHPVRFLGRHPPSSRVPAGETLSLPRSEALHARLTEGDFVPADKKPPIIDLFKSIGPYLVSVDDDPLVIFDAASQIATHAAGLNAPQVVDAMLSGRFGRWPIDNGDAAEGIAPPINGLAQRLRKAAGAHPWVRFCNSGAEANELALATAQTLRPGRRAIVAFRGGFHGRTMLALHTTWNPKKRERFELEGHQARWVDFPNWKTPQLPAVEPAGWLDVWSVRDGRLPEHGDDPVLAEEITILQQVREALADDQVVSVICEPMQSEGGERYASPRFFRGLRALTTAFDVPLIMDEVQTGFHLGGPFFWHRLFDLPTPPDFVTCAKKCQVGALVSRVPIPVASDVATASVVRGTVHAELLATADVAPLTELVRERLDALAAKHPKAVLAPRATGYAFGFDLPDPASVAFIIGQRLWRGYMLYGAGDRALRFRLHPEMNQAMIEALFERLDHSLSDLEAGGTVGWRDGATEGLSDNTPDWPPRRPLSSPYRMFQIEGHQWPLVRSAYEALQKSTYEPARVDNFDHFTALMDDPDAICFAVVQGAELPPRGKLVGACVAFPLEHFGYLDGPNSDVTLGLGTTLYSADLTVEEGHRGQGLGRLLKEAQVCAAMRTTSADGSPRYEFITGRNRVGATTAMASLNALFGASRGARLHGQYGEPDGVADYYRICLTTPRLPRRALATQVSAHADFVQLDGQLERRLGDITLDRPGTGLLREAMNEGRFAGAVANKLSLCNFATPGVVRAFEMLRALAPRGLGHLIVGSGRAEMLDKTLRSLKFHRGRAHRVISVGEVDAGESTAAARSVTRAADAADNWFGWPTVGSPADDIAGTVEALRKALAEGPTEEVLAVIIEPVSQLTARAVAPGLWEPLRALCDDADVPLVLYENATAGYRSGHGMWRADSLPVPADAVLWFPGGQLGLGFVNDRYYVPDKLTLISTWAGDEVSLIRLCLELRAARALPIARVAHALTQALAPLGTIHGEGLYLSVETARAQMWRRRLAERHVHVGATRDGALRVVPPLNLTDAEVAHVAEVIRELTQ